MSRLGGAVADTNHAAGAVGFLYSVVPGQRREAHEPVLHRRRRVDSFPEEGRSHRRKIVDSFEINLNRCILCGICVDVCNFDAIVMSHEHELSAYQRNGARMDLPDLLKIGQKFQRETAWIPPTQRAKQAQEESAESESGDEVSPAAASGEP